jgi:hypothetical protein
MTAMMWFIHAVDRPKAGYSATDASQVERASVLADRCDQ